MMKISAIAQQITHNKNRIRIIWPMLILIGLIGLGEVLIVDPMSKLLLGLGLPDVTGVLPKSWNESLGDILKRIVRIIVVLGSLLIVNKYIMKRTRSFLGLKKTKNNFGVCIIGLGFGFAIQIVSIVLMSGFGMYEITGYSFQYNSINFILFSFLYSIFYSFEAGIIEEFFFRGFVFNIFEEKYSTNIAIVITSVTFGIIHFSGFNEDFAWWMSIISSLFTGIMFAQALLLFRNIWLPVFIHTGWHMAARMLGSVGLKSDEAIFLVTNVEGPVELVSTKAGGAGLFELIGVIVIMIFMLVARFLSKHKGIVNV